jgi:hypothetical protein
LAIVFAPLLSASRELGHVALWSRAIIFKLRHYHGIVAAR